MKVKKTIYFWNQMDSCLTYNLPTTKFLKLVNTKMILEKLKTWSMILRRIPISAGMEKS